MLTRRSFIGALPALYAVTKCDSLAQIATSGGGNYYVGKDGNDHNNGSPSHPFLTISAAAAVAQTGDTITVHEGIYRERIDPPRGGASSAQPIIYRAAPGEQVEICGAEEIKGWKKDKDNVWTVTIPNSFFGTFNPYSDLIHGDWFDPKGRQHHTGAVYLDGDWLIEAAALDDVYKAPSGTSLWFGRVDDQVTTLWAQFPQADPNQRNVEINVRQSVFYPSKPGMNYITVRGFRLRCAATPWAPPTAEQIGLIGVNWSKGWVIENNDVSYSTCSGISLGKYGDQYDNTSQNSAEGYVKTIERATARGWTKENIGGHTVRNNKVSHCEQTGIVGSLGAIFSTVTGNTIHDIHVRQLFSGAEMAGIKFHAAIDTEISHNHIHHTCRGIWLDWMAQGAHVSRNLFHDNLDQDLFVEVDHGPFVVDNNLFLSKVSQLINSSGGAYAHNLFCGSIQLIQYDARQTPFMEAHSTVIAGLHDNPSGDMRFYNNLLARGGELSAYDEARLPSFFGGNLFLQGAKSCKREEEPLLKPDFDADIQLKPSGKGFVLELNVDRTLAGGKARKIVSSEMLGIALIPKLPYQQRDGSPVRLATDYSGKPRNPDRPFPGPFEVTTTGRLRVPIVVTSA
jgi:alpha-N-arabinofuranosidase